MCESAKDSWSCLSSLADVVEPLARCRTEFFEECRSGALDDVVVIYRTFESVDLTGRFDKELVSSLPGSVRFVCHNGMKHPDFKKGLALSQ
jgi:glyoxylate reductase